MADLQIDEGALQEHVMSQLTTFVRGFVSTVVSTAKTTTAPKRTGYLASQISGDPVRRAGWTLSSGITSAAPYSAPVHEGARPHVIRPRHARALRFEIGERVVFARKVNHPGNRPNAYLTNAVHRVASADPRITF